MEKFGRARQATDDSIWRVRFAYWTSKSTNTHSEYVIYFPQQKWLRERNSLLRYTYIVCVVYILHHLFRCVDAN